MAELSQTRRHQLSQFFLKLDIGIPSEIVDWHLLDLALTHPSLDSHHNNDRLEFLGDAILRWLVGDFLYSTYPQLPVGQLTLLRSDLLSNRYFASLAERYDFEAVLQVGGSAFNDAKGRNKRHADAFEAVVGALYLCVKSADRSPPLTAQLTSWLQPLLQSRADSLLRNLQSHNAKTALQEFTQRQWGELPTYRVDRQSGSPSPFVAEVWVRQDCWGRGIGRSKKAAETEAAIAALQKLQA